jgi:hypothetical protein
VSTALEHFCGMNRALLLFVVGVFVASMCGDSVVNGKEPYCHANRLVLYTPHAQNTSTASLRMVDDMIKALAVVEHIFHAENCTSRLIFLIAWIAEERLNVLQPSVAEY